MTRDENKGIIISLLIYALLCVITAGYFTPEGLIHTIGGYSLIVFMVIITVVLGLGIYSMYNMSKITQEDPE